VVDRERRRGEVIGRAESRTKRCAEGEDVSLAAQSRRTVKDIARMKKERERERREHWRLRDGRGASGIIVISR
jgi:hypothetical protein